MFIKITSLGGLKKMKWLKLCLDILIVKGPGMSDTVK